MLFVCVLGYLPKSFMFSMIAEILFASVSFDHFLSMLIVAILLFNVWITLSTIPLTLVYGRSQD